MQNLANRHADRAQRLANNRAESAGVFNNGAISVGTAAIAYRDFAAIASRLPVDQRAEFDDARRAIDEEFSTGYRSLAESPDGSGTTMAGIGVVNAAVVPAAVLASSDEGGGVDVGSDPAWHEPPVTAGSLPEAEIDANDNVNLGGQSLTNEVGNPGAWGTTTPAAETAETANAGNGGGDTTAKTESKSGKK